MQVLRGVGNAFFVKADYFRVSALVEGSPPSSELSLFGSRLFCLFMDCGLVTRLPHMYRFRWMERSTRVTSPQQLPSLHQLMSSLPCESAQDDSSTPLLDRDQLPDQL